MRVATSVRTCSRFRPPVILGVTCTFFGTYATAQQPLPSRVFRAAEFEHENWRYTVNLDAGKVVGSPLQPPPPAAEPKAFHVTFFTHPLRQSEQRRWFSSPEVLAVVAQKKLTTTVFCSTDEVVDALGQRSVVRRNGSPCFVIYGRDGTILREGGVRSAADLLQAIKDVE